MEHLPALMNSITFGWIPLFQTIFLDYDVHVGCNKDETLIIYSCCCLLVFFISFTTSDVTCV